MVSNVTIEKNSQKFIVDIGINHNEIGTESKRAFYFQGEIDDIGDLSTYFGFDEIDCAGLTIDTAQIFPEKFESFEKLNNS